jgi:hypothetical protein
MFTNVVRNFIFSIVSQRRRLNQMGVSRINMLCSENICTMLYNYFNAYNYTDTQAAVFFIRNHAQIKFILPGEGSNNNSARRQKFVELFNQSHDIIKAMEKEKFSFYKVTNDHGEAYIKTSHKRCIIVKTSYYNSEILIDKYDEAFKRTGGDVIIEIPEKLFIEQFNTATRTIKKAVV